MLNYKVRIDSDSTISKKTNLVFRIVNSRYVNYYLTFVHTNINLNIKNNILIP